MVKVQADKTRTQWGAQKAKRARKTPRGGYSGLEVHHAASPDLSDMVNYASDEQLMRSIQRFHQVTQGWNDIFYNGVVSADGTIWQGRYDTPNGKYRLMFIGNFEEEQPTFEQVATLRRVSKMFDEPIDTHRWRAAGTKYASLCPGENMIAMVEMLNQGEDMADDINYEASIAQLYRKILLREPDEGGLEFWIGQVESGARSYVDCVVEFIFVFNAALDARINAITDQLDNRGDLGLATGITADEAQDIFYEELILWQKSVLEDLES